MSGNDPISPPRSARSRPRSRPEPCPPHAALVLDRTDQWKRLRERCAADDHNLVIFVHGDHEQDLDLFLKRIKLHFKTECTRRHNVLRVLRTREHSTASTALDWGDSIIAASPLRASLADALASAARTLDALYILEDYGHPLKGLRWPDFEGLIDLCQNLIPAAIEQRRPARPLRFVVPLQHDPQDAKATRKYLKDTTKALTRQGGFTPHLLKELDLPTGKDFERFAVELLGPLARPEKATLAALYKDLTDRKKNPRQTYRTLADALQGFCDRTALARDAARRPG